MDECDSERTQLLFAGQTLYFTCTLQKCIEWRMGVIFLFWTMNQKDVCRNIYMRHFLTFSKQCYNFQICHPRWNHTYYCLFITFLSSRFPSIIKSQNIHIGFSTGCFGNHFSLRPPDSFMCFFLTSRPVDFNR